MLKKILSAVLIIVLTAALGAGAVYYMDYQKRAPQREDYERIAAEDYNSVFFSTFPIDHFTEEDFIHYRALYPVKASYCIPDPETLNEYFLKVSESWNDVSVAYLGIRPDIITAEDVINLTAGYPDIYFVIILAYPSMKYWTGLDQKEYPVVMQAYQDFINTIMPLFDENDQMYSRMCVCFYNSSEWLVSNPAHYESDFEVNKDISHKISMLSDAGHEYRLTESNYLAALENFEELVETSRNTPIEYPDLSKWDVVFFGDSIIAFEDTSSIPCALSGLTGAHVYNCARGGAGAAQTDKPLPGICTVADAFITGDLSMLETDSLTYIGISDYQKSSRPDRQKCFVLNFGLNDYFNGSAISSEDPYDPATYSGALRAAADKLQAAYPDSVILILTPNYTIKFNSGLEPQSDTGGILPDYVAAAISLSEEKDLLLFDSYQKLGINNTNYGNYLLDGVHPNESTRFYMAQCLAELLGKTAID